jgi:hypothetical protein
MEKSFWATLSVAVVLCFTACETNEDFSNVDDLKEVVSAELTADEMRVLYQMRNKNNKIGLDEATAIANEVIAMLDADVATKAGASRRIAQIKAVKTAKTDKALTKSTGGEDVEMPDTLAYIFNFADSTGFTIIAGDTRVETPILCYVGNGTLGDTINNNGIAIFLQGAESYIERSILESEQLKDSLMEDILAKIEIEGVKDTVYITEEESATKALTLPPQRELIPQGYEDETATYYEYGPWMVLSKVGPLLPVEWGQRAPFNANIQKNCSNHSSGKAPVGCVAVATSYILTYWFNKKNVAFTIDGYNINSNLLCRYTWYPNRYDGVASNNITSNTTEAFIARLQLASLMERIGSRLDMDYDCDGSGTTTEKASKYLRNIGFSGGYETDYNLNTVLSSLNNSRPVMIRGKSKKTTYLGISWLYTLSGGHAWVIDGYLKRIRQVTVTVTKRTTQAASVNRLMLITTTSTNTYNEYSPSYLHNNWGNYSGNGYFVEGSFNTNNTPISSNTKSGQDGNYQFGVDIFPDIYY